MRQEYGAFLAARKHHIASLLKNLEIDDSDQPLSAAIEQSYTRRDWPKDFVQRVAAHVMAELERNEHFRKALDLQSDFKLDEAIQELREHAKMRPNDADARQLMVLILQQRKQWAQLIEITTKALARRPYNATYYSTRARAYRELQILEPALTDAWKALELNPKSEEVQKLVTQIEDDLKQAGSTSPAKDGAQQK
jgi:tetratricopeptide (TPR) repeat protein